MSKIRWSAVALLSALALACGAHAQTEQPAHSGELDRLVAQYESLRGVVVVSVYEDQETRRESAVGRDGRFCVLHRQKTPDGAESVFGIVAFDGEHMQSHNGLSNYEEFVPDAAYVSFPGPINRWDAPWLWVGHVAETLTAQPDTVIARHNGLWRASSDLAGWLLEWDDQQRLRRVRRDPSTTAEPDAQPAFDIQLSDFSADRAANGVQWPGRVKTVFLLSGEGETENPVLELKNSAIEFDPEDFEGRVLLDAESIGAHRVDSLTGNVYTPDGKFLYNQKAFLRSFDDNRGLRSAVRQWWLPLLSLAVVGSSLLAYKRLRKGTSP